jgi:RNA polymerase sigma-70 factor (ECF subfamily)
MAGHCLEVDMVAVIAHRLDAIRAERAADSVLDFESLVRRYERQIYAYTYRMMGGNAADAEDLTQETFLKAYRALSQTSDVPHLSAWLYRIAANNCRDEWRRRQRRHAQPWDTTVQEPITDSSTDADPEAVAIRHETDARIQAILDRMKPRNKRALVLKECAGLSCEDIGAVMGISGKAVKSTLFRAREEFRLRCQEAKETLHAIPAA